MFTCLVSRAVHIEVSNWTDTDSFIQALNRTIESPGNVGILQYDNGSNFVGIDRKWIEESIFKDWPQNNWTFSAK